MLTFLDALKRIVVGKPFTNARLQVRALPKRRAVPVFSANSWSSVAYSPDEILMTLALAGVAAISLSGWVGLAVVIVLLLLVASYRQSLLAYPSNGGDYRIAKTNLGDQAGIVVASALSLDYVLTVAVSMSAAGLYLVSAIEDLDPYRLWITVGGIIIVALIQIRGLNRPSRGMAVISYAFIGTVFILCVAGFIQALTGTLALAPSAGYEIIAEQRFDAGLTSLAGAMLIMRAFATGAAAMTGLETPVNNVARFSKPRAKNAARTLVLMGVVASLITLPVIILASLTQVHIVQDAGDSFLIEGAPGSVDMVQTPVLAQLAQTIFVDHSWMFIVIVTVTALILLVASYSAFTGFSELGSTLAHDGFLPRQLRNRGDRLSYSNSIAVLAVTAVVITVVFNAELTRLIHVYIVGVFVAFSLGQWGMVRHWTKKLRGTGPQRLRWKIRYSRALNFAGMVVTIAVLAVVLVTKFLHGAWVAVLVILLLSLYMYSISAHYRSVARELEITEDTKVRALPSRVHAIILVSHVRKPVLRAIAFARASRPSSLEAIVVDTDEEQTEGTLADWERLDIPVPITVLNSPYRETVAPILGHIKAMRQANPRDLIVVYIPEYVVGRWWEQLVHNQTALRIKTRLHYMPGVMVASVPWQLSSTRHRQEL